MAFPGGYRGPASPGPTGPPGYRPPVPPGYEPGSGARPPQHPGYRAPPAPGWPRQDPPGTAAPEEPTFSTWAGALSAISEVSAARPDPVDQWEGVVVEEGTAGDARVRLSGDVGTIWAPCNVAVNVGDLVDVRFYGEGALAVEAVIG